MKLTKSSAVAHPEGWFKFKVIKEEESKGKFGTQIKWTMRSEIINEETEEPIEMPYFTGVVLSSHEKCKLTQLFVGCGILTSPDQIDELGDEPDSDVLLGKTFEGRVDAPATEGGYFNIGAVRPKRAVRAPVKPASTDNDPFADE